MIRPPPPPRTAGAATAIRLARLGGVSLAGMVVRSPSGVECGAHFGGRECRGATSMHCCSMRPAAPRRRPSRASRSTTFTTTARRTRRTRRTTRQESKGEEDRPISPCPAHAAATRSLGADVSYHTPGECKHADPVVAARELPHAADEGERGGKHGVGEAQLNNLRANPVRLEEQGCRGEADGEPRVQAVLNVSRATHASTRVGGREMRHTCPSESSPRRKKQGAA